MGVFNSFLLAKLLRDLRVLKSGVLSVVKAVLKSISSSGIVVETGSGVDGRNKTSGREWVTRTRFNGIIPASCHPPHMFSAVIATSLASM